MIIASVTTSKNQFSWLIEQVKHGETILITKRNKPVARLMPANTEESIFNTIYTSGLISTPKRRLDLAMFLAAPRASTTPGHSLTSAIIEDRWKDCI